MKKTMFAATALCAVLAICGCGGKTTPPDPEPAPEPVLPQYDIREGHFDMDANADFSVKTVQKRENSPLEGKLFYFLGSSVTYGAASDGESMADFLAALTGCTCVKEAVSGTTIFDDGKTDNTGTKSYTRRGLPRRRGIRPRDHARRRGVHPPLCDGYMGVPRLFLFGRLLRR